MKTSICTIIKDEHLFLEEWIEWHLGLGFDAIHLFEDKGSKSHEEICEKYSNVYLRRYEDDEDLQNIISPKYNNGKQFRLYQWFYETTDSDWVAFIDIDEFIMFEEGWDLEKFCTYFSEYPAVHLYWKMKGASGHIKRPNCKVMDAYTEDAPFVSSDVSGWNLKSIVNVRKGSGMRTVHHAHDAVRTDGLENTEVPTYKIAWINHYFSKSWEDWCDRIFSRGDVYTGNRKLSLFFENNPGMKHLQKELIDSVSDRIPNGTYWLDRQKGIIAGGNIKRIMKLNSKL